MTEKELIKMTEKELKEKIKKSSEFKEVKTYCRILHDEEDDLILKFLIYAREYVKDILQSTIKSCYSIKEMQKKILEKTMNDISVKMLINMLVADKYENRGSEIEKKIKSSRCSSLILKIQFKIMEEAR